MRQIEFWLGGLCLALCWLARCALAEPLPLQLYPEQAATQPGAERQRPPLKVGVVLDEYIPYYVRKDGTQLQGISADYLALIGRQLGRRIEALPFNDKQQLLQALRTGAIDLLAGNQSDLAADLLSTHAYFPNRIIEVKRIDEDNSRRPRIAIGKHPALAAQLARIYPGSPIQGFDNGLQAMQAVAFGQADLYIGNPTEANFLINQLSLDSLEIANYSALEDDPFVFLLRKDNSALQSRVNDALSAIPGKVELEVQKRWQGGNEHYNISQQIKLSPSEQAWIKAHPVVRYSAPADLYPLAFKTSPDAPAAGMAIELLQKIAQRTGLRFIEAARSGNHQLVDFSRAEVDIIPNLVVSDRRRQDMLFSMPYAHSLWGVITRSDDSTIRTLADLAGKKVAIIRNSAARESISDPALRARIQFVEAADMLASFRLLAEHKVDANINSLLTANAIVRNGELGRFKVIGTANQTPLDIAIGTSRTLPLLAEIINKAVLAIPQEELDKLRLDWVNSKASTMHVGLSRLNDHHYQNMIWLLVASLVALLILIAYRTRCHWQQQRALRDRLDTLGRLVDQLPFALFIKLPGSGIELSNPPYRALRAQSEDGALEVLQRDIIAVARTEGRSAQREGQVSTRQGKQDLLLWAKPFFTLTQDEGAILGGWFDITPLKHSERALEQARDDAESANRAKTTFLAVISHEIRTPMNAILGLLELELKKAANTNLSTIFQSATSLLHLLDGILDQAKMEAGQLSIAPHPAQPWRMLASMAALYGPIAKENGLSLALHTDPALPETLFMDEKRVSQILGNVLGNAIKFTEQGDIRIDCQWQPQSPGQGVLQLDIRDTGRGISDEAQASIFDAYAQENPATKSGTGLGLWICANLLRQMGGDISLASQLGVGTLVSIRIPCRSDCDISQDTSTPLPQQVEPALRVLVVDDHPANRLLLEQQLRFIGLHDIHSLPSAEEALALLEAEHCDIVISDCFMPGMDGFSLARQLRARTGKQPYIIGYTADARPRNLSQALAAGMDCCLTKPVNIEQLTAALAACPRDDASQQRRRILQERIAGLKLATVARQQFIDLMQESNQQDIAALQQASAQADFVQMSALTHKLMGAARMVQDQEMLSLSELLQDSVSQQSLAECQEIVADLVQAVAECNAMLEQAR
ncbi:response regulator [Aquitalea aquatica]|uniref:histidine kinase n=1 Tax=Aquitalea aquatica TaxID=3044273 RepID=A0A838YI59_9NEIS|nr:transporter substrate-binding domain-containing protein [Aquitalea magnusonii]MBA4710404.1 transporter substrate-binding domain-containing protein [Aquitalea magnusonii]